jgi:hypothetical protein
MVDKADAIFDTKLLWMNNTIRILATVSDQIQHDHCSCALALIQLAQGSQTNSLRVEDARNTDDSSFTRSLVVSARQPRERDFARTVVQHTEHSWKATLRIPREWHQIQHDCPTCLETFGGQGYTHGSCAPICLVCKAKWATRSNGQTCPLCRGIYEDVCLDRHVDDDDAESGRANAEFGYSDYEFSRMLAEMHRHFRGY